MLAIPLLFAGVYLSILLIVKLLKLPSDQNLVTILQGYFSHYGLWLVFIGAIIEGFLFLGQYFPGGTIIFLGVVSAGKNIFAATEVVLLVMLAFFIGYALDYVVGRYGWYNLLVKFGLRQSLENAKVKIQKQAFNTVILSYWEPNLASITATAAGIIRISLPRFLMYSLIGIAIWETFWGALVFSLGNAMLRIMGFKYLLIIFLVWVIAILLKNYVFDNKKLITNHNG